MRIIAGTRRGLKLIPFAGRDIRPTADRLRESVFNIIGPIGDNCRVLDLFAGTGALGIEALSRGAAEAVFIDKDPKALALIKANLARCRFTDRARVLGGDIATALARLGSQPRCVDLVFIDPPYAKGLVAAALDQLHRCAIPCPEALVVVEHDQAEPVEVDGGPFVREGKRRVYGKTLVSFLRYMV